MADFPTAKTNAVDNVTDVLAKHINNLENKVGIDSSTDISSLDYKVNALESALPSGAIVGTTDTQTLTNKTLTSPLFAGVIDGWISAEETWTYASATTITVPSGAASRYQKGDKIKLTQTTVKYFYIIGVADTVLTVTGGSDYTVANAAITSPYFSKIENPHGFPAYFAYTPTITGFTSNPTVSAKFSLNKTVCTVNYPRIEGTSNAATVTLTLPIVPANSVFVPVFGYDNDAWQTVMCYLTVTGGNGTATAYKTLVANFTASGGKKLAEFNMTYLI